MPSADSGSRLELLVTGVVEDAATRAERCPISAPRPTASAIVCDEGPALAIEEAVGETGKALPVVGLGTGLGVAAAEVAVAGLCDVDGAGEGDVSTADANPDKPGLVSREVASATIPKDFRARRRD